MTLSTLSKTVLKKWFLQRLLLKKMGLTVVKLTQDNYEGKYSELSDIMDSSLIFYFQENFPSNDPSEFFTEVAHEEIVIEDILIVNAVEEKVSNVKTV